MLLNIDDTDFGVESFFMPFPFTYSHGAHVFFGFVCNVGVNINVGVFCSKVESIPPLECFYVCVLSSVSFQ